MITTRKTPQSAFGAYLRLIQAVLSCVTNDVIRGSGVHATEQPLKLSLGRDQPVRLRSVASLGLTARQDYQIVPIDTDRTRRSWAVEVVGYSYAVLVWNGPEIIAYHSHPGSDQKVRFPHLHLESGAQIGREELVKAHLPTGLVSITDIVRLVIEEFHVEPRRRDWQRVLDEAMTVDQ